MSYGKPQEHLRKLWEELLSDEEIGVVDSYEDDATSDEYEPGSESSESETEYQSPLKKVKQNVRDPMSLTAKPRVGTSSAANDRRKPNSTDEIIDEAIRNMQYDQNLEIESTTIGTTDYEWFPATGKYLKDIQFSVPDPGFHKDFYDLYKKTPYEFYKIFVDDDIISMIVQESNRYAEQCIQKKIFPKTTIQNWTPTNNIEIENFIGIILWMGLCSFPTLSSYWQRKPIYTNYIPSVMSKNRFQLLLKMLHFSNNEEISQDKLQKLTPLLNKLRESFQRPITPSEYMCIDETFVPFQGRLRLRQHKSNERHKFGIKLFKLCLKDGYTFDFKVYCGKSKDVNVSVSKVVMSLMENLLDKGRTLCTSNNYTSVSLAYALLKRETHLLGTLRSKRKFNPKEVINKKLKPGETVAEECTQGIIIQKWKDKRDVLVLSTKYGNEMINTNRRDKEIQKPKNVLEYNKYKSCIDKSNQFKTFGTGFGRRLKWYRKLAFQLLTETALVNAHIAYTDITNNKISITSFKEGVIDGLLRMEVHKEEGETQHKLEDVGRSRRRRCVACYKTISEELGRDSASKKTPQTTLKCVGCDQYFCLQCFFDVHKTYKVKFT